MIKLAIFDLDGTLVNTLADLAYSSNCALEEHGFPTHAVEKYRYFVGNGVYKLIERMTPEEKRTPEMLADLKSGFDRYYSKNYLRASAPYAGIYEELAKLAAQGIKLAVLSNKAHEFTSVIVKSLFPEVEFCAVFGQREGVPTKPNPQAVLEVMDIAGVTPEETCFVGDSAVDIATGKNSGAHPVGVTWGFREREELAEAGADHLVDRMDDLAGTIVHAG